MDIKGQIDQIISKFEALPPSRKNILLVISPLLIIGLAVYFVAMPSFQEKGRLEEDIGKQMGEIGVLQKKSAGLPELLAENKRLEDKLKQLQMQLPEEKEVSGLLKQVSELGVKSGLLVVSWKPRPRTVHPSNEVYEIPVDVSMRGPYHMFGQFFSNVTGLSRIVNISNITMSVGDQKMFARGMVGLNVNFSAITYSLLPEQEKKALMKKGQNK
jgi:type IV pilus assembly protein PilO